MTRYGITTDYDYNAGHKRDRIDVYSGPWYHTWDAEGYSLPNGDGYMLTTYNGDKVRVSCPTPRNDGNYLQVDEAINAALNHHFANNL